MPDREKVIKGLEHCRKTACESCPYNATDVKNSNPICLINEMLSDALALLKEQEAVEPNPLHNSYRWFTCGKCACLITREDRFCPRCGRMVKWNKTAE